MWYAQAVAAAAEAGFMTDHTNQLFAPNEPLTREEIADNLVRAAEGFESISCRIT
ncbi:MULTISPECIES: S-layer homology domain-containing protein [unclassified Paenibacillus]|uniref:S-layer homology domain-containing protein n=1 Tax=unclassified Paenibacillus TaxID=185978 RepID=UPI00363D0039